MKFLCLALAAFVALTAPAVTLPDCGGKTVKASDFGFASGDSTDALKSALNSDAARVIIDLQTENWVTGSVAITNGNKEIIVEDGVVIRAKPGAFVGVRERLFAIVRATNVVLRGVGRCGIVMRKQEYQDKTRYAPSEFRDCIQIWGSKNVAVSNLFCRSSGGDGVEVTLSDGVILEDLVCEDNHRQGSSINCCENLTVRRCVFNTTEGTWPMCGVDLEPFRKTQKLENILYEDCVFEGNRASGIDLHLSALDGTSPPVSVTFRRCKARRNRFFGLQMYSAWSVSGVKGSVTFEDCEFSDNGYCPMRITNQFADGLRIVFRDCTFDTRGGQEPHAILLDNARVMKSIGGITFENCRLTTEGDKVPVAIRNMTGFGVDGLGGEISVVRDGHQDPYHLAAFVTANPPHPEKVSEFRSMPVDYACLTGVGGRLSEPTVTPPLGGNIVFIQHVPEAGRYPIAFACRRLKGTAPWPRVQVRDRAGTDLGGFDLRDGEFEHIMTVSGDALHRFEIAAGEDFAVTVASPWIGQGVQCDDFVRVVPTDGKGAHRAHFTVFGKARNVRVEIRSEGNSPAVIRDGSGAVLDKLPERCAHQSFRFDRPAATAADETWSVEFPAPRTPFAYRIGGGAVSVWTTAPAAALKRIRGIAL